MITPVSPKIKHHVDPMRYPKIQGAYEQVGKKSFHPIKLFGDIVQTMVEIVKERR